MILICTAALFCTACSGCSFIGDFIQSLRSGYSVYFRNSDITMQRGDVIKIDYDDIMFVDLDEGVDVSEIGFSVYTEDVGVVLASGKTIEALRAGDATVILTTADNVYAYLDITVQEEIESIQLGFPAGRWLPQNSDSSVDVYAVLNDGSMLAGDYSINWTVDGSAVNFNGNPLTLYKESDPKVYEVTATINSHGKRLSATTTAGYYPQSVSYDDGAVIADRTTINAGESVNLSLSTPFSYAEWYINDTPAGTQSESMVFTPDKAGYYDVYAVLAGIKTPSVRLTVNGVVIPENLKVSFDDTYPLLEVTWEGADGVSCRVSAVPEGASEPSLTVNSTKGNALLALDTQTANYEIYVEVIENAHFQADKTPSSLSFSMPDDVQKEFLTKSYYDGNYYITDEKEFFDFFDYMMYFRKQPQSGQTTLSSEYVYMAYDYGDYYDLLDRAFDYSGITGSYNLGGSVVDNVANIQIEFFTVDTPSYASSYDARYHYDSLDALPVHWNANGSKRQYFANAGSSVSVWTTDQMFRVAEKGYMPVPQRGSPAEKAYEYAVGILDSIVSADMDDMHTALAIYEYIMYKNTYDGSVLDYDIDQSVKSASFYMESILSEGESFGVCDAMSKTLSFLCNMANVKAVRVVGYAGTGADKGGHAWNKVRIDGMWYVVDPTWGDSNVTIVKKNGLRYSYEYPEGATHAYFLLTDADIDDTHVSYTLDDPVTSPLPYIYYRHETLGENFGDQSLYLQSQGETLRHELENIAAYLATTTKSSKNYNAYGIDRVSYYDGIEFEVCSRSVKEAETLIKNKSQSSFLTALEMAGLNYNIFREDNTFYVIVSYNGGLYNSVFGEDDNVSFPPIWGWW